MSGLTDGTVGHDRGPSSSTVNLNLVAGGPSGASELVPGVDTDGVLDQVGFGSFQFRLVGVAGCFWVRGAAHASC